MGMPAWRGRNVGHEPPDPARTLNPARSRGLATLAPHAAAFLQPRPSDREIRQQGGDGEDRRDVAAGQKRQERQRRSGDDRRQQELTKQVDQGMKPAQ